ncbi:hypothetical protein [Denitratisoma oestradiolicum]|uniref:Uncharacterized protein n=1 Tax=Denitratisoma oestradiolicum TaxID=311182 RepID=A0A6S6XWR4_9PROT|nr:hypothetical protein [Denitratisoma oestradiolicum]TWO79661.1 hypothetical protein CBW56_13895 [Denitratisoma oestradiolicum]CAB1370469.1 conserved protein of unknown function [Denitratisoma oestradiolicum]
MNAIHHLGGFAKPTELTENERRHQCVLEEAAIPKRRIGDSRLKMILWTTFPYGWLAVGIGAFYYFFIR